MLKGLCLIFLIIKMVLWILVLGILVLGILVLMVVLYCLYRLWELDWKIMMLVYGRFWFMIWLKFLRWIVCWLKKSLLRLSVCRMNWFCDFFIYLLVIIFKCLVWLREWWSLIRFIGNNRFLFWVNWFMLRRLIWSFCLLKLVVVWKWLWFNMFVWFWDILVMFFCCRFVLYCFVDLLRVLEIMKCLLVWFFSLDKRFWFILNCRIFLCVN